MTQPIDDIRGKINDAITAIRAAQNALRQLDAADSIKELDIIANQLTIFTMHRGWLWHIEHGEDADDAGQ